MGFPRRIVLIAALLGSAVSGLTACSSFPFWSAGKEEDADIKDEHADWGPAQFYAEAKHAMMDGSYEKAIKLYEKLEARYPFGEYATQAQIDVAFCYYKNNEPESAIASVDRFIKLNPTEPHVDYAYYLRGLINYNRGIGFIDRWLPTDSSQRDPGSARDAYNDFETLLNKFPNSVYREDAKQRAIALRNNLAMYDIHVADYYMRRRAYVAAIRRSAEVVQKYQRTQAIPHALKIMEDAYRQLDMPQMADDIARVYALNYAEGRLSKDEDYERTVMEEVWDFVGFDK